MIADVELESLRERLLQEQEKLRDQIAAARRSAQADDAFRSDDGAHAYEQDRAVSLASGLRTALEDVERALGKLEEGTYGECDGCGDDIPLERLPILPQATLCVTCKSKRTKSSARGCRSAVAFVRPGRQATLWLWKPTAPLVNSWAPA